MFGCQKPQKTWIFEQTHWENALLETESRTHVFRIAYSVLAAGEGTMIILVPLNPTRIYTVVRIRAPSPHATREPEASGLAKFSDAKCTWAPLRSPTGTSAVPMCILLGADLEGRKDGQKPKKRAQRGEFDLHGGREYEFSHQ